MVCAYATSSLLAHTMKEMGGKNEVGSHEPPGGKGRTSAADNGQREISFIYFFFVYFVKRKSRTERLRSRFGDYIAVAVLLLYVVAEKHRTFVLSLYIADRNKNMQTFHLTLKLQNSFMNKKIINKNVSGQGQRFIIINYV